MNHEKKMQRYTRIGDIYVNLKRYKEQLSPTENGCLEWKGGHHRQGYGMINILTEDAKTSKMTVVHRVAMRIKLNRELLPSEDVGHACANLSCCNPNHIYIKE